MKKELELRTKRFALAVIKLVSELPRSRSTEVLRRQLLRSGTSIGANYREANRAASKSDLFTSSRSVRRRLAKLSIG